MWQLNQNWCINSGTFYPNMLHHRKLMLPLLIQHSYCTHSRSSSSRHVWYIIIMDCFRSSIKDSGRQRHVSQVITFCITGPEQQSTLKSSSFKRALVRFLANDWRRDCYDDVLADHQVHFVLDNECFCFTARNADHESILALKSFHEEADTRMVYHVHHVIQNQRLHYHYQEQRHRCTSHTLIHMSQRNSNVRVWLDAGLSSHNTRTFTRY